MSDELDIRHGGTVAVDTATLRACAVRLDDVGRAMTDAAGSARWASSLLHSSGPAGEGLGWRVGALSTGCETVERSARDLAERLRTAADVYEYVELRAERAAADPERAAQIDARIAELLGSSPLSVIGAALEQSAPDLPVPTDILAQTMLLGGALGPGMALFAGWNVVVASLVVAALGHGTIPGGARISGPAVPVVVAPIARTPGAAPQGMRDVVARVPDGDSRVRVERYTMPGGTRQFVVYVGGSQSRDIGGREPFDMLSNLGLRRGDRTASYDAAVEAMRESGVRRDDAVHVVGYSQGAMVASHLALEEGYDVQTLVTIGSPVEADVDDDVMAISLRHTDDPVAALALGGHEAGVGSADSFVVERTADPLPGLHDVDLPAHQLSAYQRTAELLDASSDPRMDAARELFAELGGATEVEAVDYSAARPSVVSPSSPADAG